MKFALPERRRYIRIEVPLRVVIKGKDWEESVFSKNISPIGIRFESRHKTNDGDLVNMALYLPSHPSSLQMRGKVMWQEKTSTEDNAPYDSGLEFVSIAEKDKNILLKFLCDLLYSSSYRIKG